MGSFYQAYTYLQDRRCYERNRTGTCNHLLTRGKEKGKINPCQRKTDIMENFEAADAGDELPHPEWPLDRIAEWLQWQLCGKARREGRCNCKACAKGLEVIHFLKSQL